jgi:8-oxo-dGTP pyrophosphatase MutT (NUDIX family)
MPITTPSGSCLAASCLTSRAFVDLATGRFRATPPNPALATAGHTPSDFDLNPGYEANFVMPPVYRLAAVLVAIVARAEPHVLFTQRTATLSKHAGQIAFPGGIVDASDTGPLMTALRETHEEVGLTPTLIKPLGYLDCYRTGTGYVITPVVGLIEPGFELTLNTREVESAFEVPLAFLLDPANHQIDRRTIQGVERKFYAMPHQDRYIWGATAGIIRNMYERLFHP